jgi:hypothetical protein
VFELVNASSALIEGEEPGIGFAAQSEAEERVPYIAGSFNGWRW